MLQLGWDHETASRLLVTEALFTAKVRPCVAKASDHAATVCLLVQSRMQSQHTCASVAGAAVAQNGPPASYVHDLQASQADRELLTQLLFEKFQIEGLFLGEQPVLALYSLGRIAGYVVDLGHDKTGHCLVKATSTILFAASLLPT